MKRVGSAETWTHAAAPFCCLPSSHPIAAYPVLAAICMSRQRYVPPPPSYCFNSDSPVWAVVVPSADARPAPADPPSGSSRSHAAAALGERLVHDPLHHPGNGIQLGPGELRCPGRFSFRHLEWTLDHAKSALWQARRLAQKQKTANLSRHQPPKCFG